MPKFRTEQRKNPERKSIMDEIITGTGEVTPAGENEQTVESTTTAESAPETVGGDENEQAHAEPAPAEQTPEQNAAFAAARRRAEAQAAVRSQAEQDALVERIYRGQTNPYTGKPIRSVRDLNEYEQQYQADQMRQAGIDPGVLNQMIEQNPVVQQARQMTAKMQQEEGQRYIEGQVSEISKVDPSIKSFADLTKADTFPQFDAMVRRGYSLVDAYKIVNFDRLTGQRAAAAKQQALNSVNGKNHLNPTKGAGSGEDVVVPEETMAMYRSAFPNWTKQQIIEDYKKHK